jgi:hypothetical protein
MSLPGSRRIEDFAMHSRLMLLAAIGLGLGLTSKAGADIGPPRFPPQPQPKANVAVKIEVDENAKGPRLIVPSQLFAPPRVRPLGPNPRGPVPIGNLNSQIQEDAGDEIAENATEPANPEKPKNGLMYAGLALTLALCFGGLWLVRKSGKGSIRSMSLVIAAGASLIVGVAVWANVAPPPPPVKPIPQPKPPAAFPSAYEGKASVEVFFGAEPVRLILDKESYEKLKKGELKEVEKNPRPNPTPKLPRPGQ